MPEPHTSDLPKPKSWEEFEDIVWNLYARLWNDPYAQRNGRSGQAQQGVDIYGQPKGPNGPFVGIQCKRYSDGTLTPAMIAQEIAKAEHFRPDLAEFIIATTESRDATLQEAIRLINTTWKATNKFSVRLVFWEDICNDLNKPTNRILLKQFYPSWFSVFEQVANALPLAGHLRHESFKLGDDYATHFPYVRTPIQGIYTAAVQAVLDASTGGSSKRGIIVLGEANAGKTRLALEVLKQALPSWQVLCWHPAHTLQQIPQLDALPIQKLVVFLDDLQEYVPVNWASEAVALVSDARPATLRALLATLRSSSIRVVVVATCRSEDEGRTRAALGFLFTELTRVEIPNFTPDPVEIQAAAIIAEFRQQGALHLADWDGTMGSLVLGLSTKESIYLELVRRQQGGATILRAMKLLALALLPEHTEKRLRAVCKGVFGVDRLQDQLQIWREAVEQLTGMQFVTKERMGSTQEMGLAIRKDTYLSQVITDYPSLRQQHQLEEDLVLLRDVLVHLGDAPGLANLGLAFLHSNLYREALSSLDQALRLDANMVIAWGNKGAALAFLGRNQEALASLEQALLLNPTEAISWSNKGAILSKLGRPEEALQAIEQSLTLDPTIVANWSNKGATLAMLKRHQEALDVLEQAIASHFTDASIWRNKGLVLADMGRIEEALVAYEQALAFDPVDSFAWSSNGAAFIKLERYEQGLTAYDQALLLDPRDSANWRNKAVALSQLERHQEALLAVEQALMLDPKTAMNWSTKGTILGRLTRQEEALACLEQALFIEPTNLSALSNKATVFSKLGRAKEALEILDDVLALDRKNVTTWRNKGQLLVVLGRSEAAIAAFEQALVLDPRHAATWGWKGKELAELARYQEALEAFDRKLALAPSSVSAWVYKGMTLMHMGRSLEALAAFEQALALQQDHLAAWQNKALLLLLLGRFPEALEAYEQVLRLDPTDWIAWYNKGTLLLGQQHYTEALAAIEQVLLLDPKHAKAWSYKGVILGALGYNEEALSAFKQALAIDPTEPLIWSHKGKFLAELGQAKEALLTFEQALTLDPKDATTWRNKMMLLTTMGRQEEALAAYEQIHALLVDGNL